MKFFKLGLLYLCFSMMKQNKNINNKLNINKKASEFRLSEELSSKNLIKSANSNLKASESVNFLQKKINKKNKFEKSFLVEAEKANKELNDSNNESIQIGLNEKPGRRLGAYKSKEEKLPSKGEREQVLNPEESLPTGEPETIETPVNTEQPESSVYTMMIPMEISSTVVLSQLKTKQINPENSANFYESNSQHDEMMNIEDREKADNEEDNLLLKYFSNLDKDAKLPTISSDNFGFLQPVVIDP